MSPLHGEKFLLPVPRAGLYGYVARRYRAARSPPPCRLSSPCSAPVCKGLSAVPSLNYFLPGRYRVRRRYPGDHARAAFRAVNCAIAAVRKRPRTAHHCRPGDSYCAGAGLIQRQQLRDRLRGSAPAPVTDTSNATYLMNHRATTGHVEHSGRAGVAPQSEAFRRPRKIERCWCCSHDVNIAQSFRRAARAGEMAVMPGRLPDRAGRPPATIAAEAYSGASAAIENAVTSEASGIAL